MKDVYLSEALQEVVGKGPMPRTEVTKKLWAYIKKHNLQDKENKRNIKTKNSKLEHIFGPKDINMFDMTKALQAHLSAEEKVGRR